MLKIRICLSKGSETPSPGQTLLGHTLLGHTSAVIRYTYTGLSIEGNREVERYDQKWFQHKMRSWEAAINHYLQTGKRIDAAEWE